MPDELKPKVIGVEHGEAVLKPLETVAPVEDPTLLKPVQPLQHLQPSQPLPAKTTAQEDITKAGQRRINLIWEVTQGVIAVIITVSVIYCSIKGIETKTLENAFVMIITMYFVRTNHSLIGGIGAKPPAYEQQR